MVSYPHAGQYGPEIFMDADQILMKSKQVTVYETGTSTLATLYTDRTKAVTAANPFTTDARGNGTFYADPGVYDLFYSGATFTVTVLIDFEDLAIGAPAGYPYVFSTTTTDSDPGAGNLRLNHGTIASATFIYVDDITSAAANIASVIAGFDASTNETKGLLEIKVQDGSRLHVWRVTGDVIDGGTYSKIPVVYVGGAGALVNGESIVMNFTAIGDAGFSPVRLTESEYAALVAADAVDPETWYVIVEDP